MLVRWRLFELARLFYFKLEEPSEEGSLQIKDGCPDYRSGAGGFPFLLQL